MRDQSLNPRRVSSDLQKMQQSSQTGPGWDYIFCAGDLERVAGGLFCILLYSPVIILGLFPSHYTISKEIRHQN